MGCWMMGKLCALSVLRLFLSDGMVYAPPHWTVGMALVGEGLWEQGRCGHCAFGDMGLCAGMRTVMRCIIVTSWLQ